MPYTFATGESGLVFAAHSVVRDSNGNLYDITPIGDEGLRPSLLFVPHVGSEAEFWEWEKSNRCIYCPGPRETVPLDEEAPIVSEEESLFPDGD